MTSDDASNSSGADARESKAGPGLTPESPAFSPLAPAVALVWCVVVVAAYYIFNYAYYREKVAVFARYLISLIS